MILKHLTIKNRGGVAKLLNYLHNSPDRLRDSNGNSFCIRHNLRNEGVDAWIQEYLDNEEGRVTLRSDSVFMNHVIISFHAEDREKLSQVVLESMAQKYIDLAADNALVVAVPHFEKDHLHVHLAISGVDCFEGKSLRMSQADFANTKEKLQDYQREKYPELEHSIVEHGHSKKKDLSDSKNLRSDELLELRRRR
jgi:hypothetical protein